MTGLCAHDMKNTKSSLLAVFYNPIGAAHSNNAEAIQHVADCSNGRWLYTVDKTM